MKKRISIFLTIILCFTMYNTAFASDSASGKTGDSYVTVSIGGLTPGYYLCAFWNEDELLTFFDATVGDDGRIDTTVDVGIELNTNDNLKVGISGANTDSEPISYDVVLTDTGDTDTPGTDTPGADKPGTDEPGTDTPGTDTPGTDTPGTDKPGTDKPGTDNPGTDTPGTDTPGTDTPGTDTPGTDKPDTDKPSNNKPSSSGGSSSGGGGGSRSSGKTISISATNNGTITVDRKNASKGNIVTITANPDEGYQLATLTVTDKNGNNIKLTDIKNNKYTFSMPDLDVNIKAVFNKIDDTPNILNTPSINLPFTDVAESSWYYDAVKYMYEKGLMSGMTDTVFSPDTTTTRSMIVSILHRIEGEPSASSSTFLDVAPNQWYTNAVAWAADNNIVSGYGNGEFGPNDIITREQMASILYRYASYKGYNTDQTADLSAFTDISEISTYAVNAIQWTNANNLISGMDNVTLAPKDSATRAQIASILMRFCEHIAK